MEDESKQVLQLSRLTRKTFKDMSYVVANAYIAEYKIFQKLENAGILAVRSYEQSPVDGAFPCHPIGKVPTTSPATIWHWARHAEDVEFLSFDIKYESLLARALKQLDFSYSYIHPKRFSGSAEVYLLLVESEEDKLAIVPKAVFELASDSAYGTLPLLAKVPTWLQPFMVEDKHLYKAIDNLLGAAKDPNHIYVNPSTGTACEGWHPRLSTKPAISPELTNRPGDVQRSISFNAIENLWDKLIAIEGVSYEFNPLSPYICDFLLKIEHISYLLRIEHKCGTDNEQGERSPYAPSRQWHFMIVQLDIKAERFYCIGRHEVLDGWPQQSHLVPDHEDRALYEGAEGLSNMLIWIGHNAPFAYQKANDVFLNPASGIADLEALVTSNRMKDVVELIEQHGREDDDDDSVANSKPKPGFQQTENRGMAVKKSCDLQSTNGRTGTTVVSRRLPSSGFAKSRKRVQLGRSNEPQYAKGLPWLADQFNQVFREMGHMVCIPFDGGHPVSNFTIVKHTWEEKDNKAFDTYREIPLTAQSSIARERKCVPTRFQDHFSGSRSLTAHQGAFASYMREAFWAPPATNQHYMIIGSTFDQDALSTSRLPEEYTLLPSEFLSLSKASQMRMESQGHDGSSYFFRTTRMKNKFPDSVFKPTLRVKPLRMGSTLMARQDVNPLRYMLDIRSIAGIYFKILYGDATEIRVPNCQSATPNASFRRETYLATLQDLHQASWRSGLTRIAATEDKGTDVVLVDLVESAGGTSTSVDGETTSSLGVHPI